MAFLFEWAGSGLTITSRGFVVLRGIAGIGVVGSAYGIMVEARREVGVGEEAVWFERLVGGPADSRWRRSARRSELERPWSGAAPVGCRRVYRGRAVRRLRPQQDVRHGAGPAGRRGRRDRQRTFFTKGAAVAAFAIVAWYCLGQLDPGMSAWDQVNSVKREMAYLVASGMLFFFGGGEAFRPVGTDPRSDAVDSGPRPTSVTGIMASERSEDLQHPRNVNHRSQNVM